MECKQAGYEEIESHGQGEVGGLMTQQVLWGSEPNNKELQATISSKINKRRRNEDTCYCARYDNRSAVLRQEREG